MSFRTDDECSLRRRVSLVNYCCEFKKDLVKRTKGIWTDLRTDNDREDVFKTLLRAKLLQELLLTREIDSCHARHPVPQEHLGSPSTSRVLIVGHRATKNVSAWSRWSRAMVGLDLSNSGVIIQSLKDRQSWLASRVGAAGPCAVEGRSAQHAQDSGSSTRHHPPAGTRRTGRAECAQLHCFARYSHKYGAVGRRYCEEGGAQG